MYKQTQICTDHIFFSVEFIQMQNVQFVSSLWGEELNPSTSAGLVGEEWKEASAGKVNNTCDDKFEKTDKEASIKQHIV